MKPATHRNWRTRQESGAEDARVPCDRGHEGRLTMVLVPVRLSWAGSGLVNLPM